jgi:hypothetical protein
VQLVVAKEKVHIRCRHSPARSDPLPDKGAVWYGQNKSMQVMAKDAFDAINNQVVFAP